MSTQHTPGPWAVNVGEKFEDRRPRIYALGDRHQSAIATVNLDGHGTQDANASLIAAAPDLLAALRGLIREVSPLMEQYQAADRRALDAARAAIAKVEGQS